MCAPVHGLPGLADLLQAVRPEGREREQAICPQYARDFREDGLRSIEPRQRQVGKDHVNAPVRKRQCPGVGLYLTLSR